MLRGLVATVVAAFTLAAPASASTSGKFLPHKRHLALTERVAYFRRSIKHERDVVVWLASKQAPRTHERPFLLRWYRAALRWHTDLLAHYSAKLHPAVGGPDLGAWLCIHGREGAWDDDAAPFWGGLQMDLSFQRTYGAEFMRQWGTADNWPVWAQLTAARRARDGYHGYHARGYNPWPNTARVCGLL